jgi:hypothetical protein
MGAIPGGLYNLRHYSLEQSGPNYRLRPTSLPTIRGRLYQIKRQTAHNRTVLSQRHTGGNTERMGDRGYY